jgi:hypothetical protein
LCEALGGGGQKKFVVGKYRSAVHYASTKPITRDVKECEDCDVAVNSHLCQNAFDSG